MKLLQLSFDFDRQLDPDHRQHHLLPSLAVRVIGRRYRLSPQVARLVCDTMGLPGDEVR